MKNNTSFKIARYMLVLVIAASLCSCTRSYCEDVESDKRTLVRRNLLLIGSDTPADVVVSYCSYSREEGENRLVRKAVKTPCMIDLGYACVVYDSLNLVFDTGYHTKKHFIRGIRYIKHDFSEGGAEFLHIENKSDVKLSAAIVGTQELKSKYDSYYKQDLVETHPQPIYKGVPLLYLLKPEETPRGTLSYVAATVSTKKNGNLAVSGNEIKKIDLSPDNLENLVGENVPFSIERVLSLYRTKERDLFLGYLGWSMKAYDPNLINDEFDRLHVFLYWEIPSGETWRNSEKVVPVFRGELKIGEIPLFAQDFHNQDELQ